MNSRFKIILCALCAFALSEARADKLTDYTSASSLLATDIFYVVTDPGGTPATHKATGTVVGTLLQSMTQTLTNKSIDLGTNTITSTSLQLKTAVSDETGSGALVFATSPTLVTPILGTPTSGTLTSCTGLPVATGISGLGTGVATFLVTPSSANLLAAVTDETGTGAAVFATSPTLVTPILGTPTSGTLTSCTGLPISTGVSGLGTSVATFLATPTSANLAAALTNETGTGAAVFGTTPTITTPNVVGTTAADDATAGSVGEYTSSMVAVGSPVSLSTATGANVTSISLTAGDWDVSGNVNFTASSATITTIAGGISTTTATIPTDGSEVNSGVRVTTTSILDSVTLPRKRINVSSTTTVYLVAKATFSAGTIGSYGMITARRIR